MYIYIYIYRFLVGRLLVWATDIGIQCFETLLEWQDSFVTYWCYTVRCCHLLTMSNKESHLCRYNAVM